MASTAGDRPVWPLTADHVVAMVDAGILQEDDPVELLDGVLTRVSPKSTQHQVVISRLFTWLAQQPAAADLLVLTEAALRVPDPGSLPEPDLLVLPAGAPVTTHPATALLVVEVAVSSQPTDLGRKATLYASAGVPEYWVVDVPGRAVVRCTDPFDGGYRTRASVVPPATLRPLGLAVMPLDVAGLLAGLDGKSS